MCVGPFGRLSMSSVVKVRLDGPAKLVLKEDVRWVEKVEMFLE